MENKDRITNEYVIRNIWSNEQLARMLITEREVDDIDYDWDDNPYVCGTYDVYTTSDGEEFCDYNDAIEHELLWFSQDAEGY